MRASLRSSDIIARIGGDEYAGLSIDADTQDAAKMLARLRSNIATCNQASTAPYELSLSIGVVEYDPQEPLSLEKLLELADKRMYVEKRQKQGQRKTLWNNS